MLPELEDGEVRLSASAGELTEQPEPEAKPVNEKRMCTCPVGPKTDIEREFEA